MASYKMEIKDGILSKTLTFMGHEFTEVWEEDNSHCRSSIERKVAETFPELEESVKGIIEDADAVFSDACDIYECINALTVYEENQ